MSEKIKSKVHHYRRMPDTAITQYISKRLSEMIAKKAYGELRVVIVGGVVKDCIVTLNDDHEQLRELQAA